MLRAVRRRGVRIRSQLLVAFVVPTILAIGTLGYFSEVATRRSLDAALGERLCAIAQSAATMVAPRIMALERGDDDARTRRTAMKKIDRLALATGVARIILVRREGDEALLDTTQSLKVGDPYGRARFDRLEIARVFEGKSVAAVLFESPEGQPFKTGYAPFVDEDDAVVGYVAVDAAATYDDAIDELRRTLSTIALLGILSIVALAFLLARQLSDPLSALSDAAQQIGGGDLEAPVPVGGPQETVVLGETMRAMMRSLKVREEEMQMMLAGIAHEVRNPLGGIELFGGLLKEDLEADDPRQKHVQKILRELGVLSKVVNDFLDFARRRDPEPRPTELHDLLFEVVSIAEPDATSKGTAIEIDVDKDLVASVDPEAMKRALLNLTRNAIQAAPKQGGAVTLRATRIDAGAVQFAIEDNGPGIPAEKREEVFAPFFTTKQKGTGLGLALVKKSVMEHGGTIAVEERPGGGARFVIKLTSE